MSSGILRRRRAELDELESLAVKDMVANDRGNRNSAGLTLNKFLTDLWHELGYCMRDENGTYQDAVLNSDEDIDPIDAGTK